MNYLTAAWDRLVRLVRPDVDAIINGFLKAQSKLEGFIDREKAILEKEWSTAMSLIDSTSKRDATIDRAYRIIHNLDQLVA